MRIRITKNVVAAVIAAASAAAVATPGAALAKGPEPVPAALLAEPFRMINQKSGKLLEPAGSATANGTKIVQKAANGSSRQRWILIVDGSYVSLENYATHTNMGVEGASTAAGKAAVLAAPSSSASQDWTLDWKDSTWFRFKNRNSGLCLGISGGLTTANAVTGQFACDNTTNQTWKLE